MPTWTWRESELAPGRIALIDVDGVISDGSGRQRFLDGPRKDWEGFFRASADDPPLLAAITLLDIIAADTIVGLLTARPESILDQTVAWLKDYEVRWDLLIMRSRLDHMEAPEMKRSAVTELRQRGFEPVFAMDDDRRIVSMYDEEDIPAIYVHSGYYD
jgi:hypothetical protein